MTKFGLHNTRLAGLFGVVLLSSFALLSPHQAQAQRWLQTARLVTPVQDGEVRAFLDTLVNVMERREDLMVKRSPSDKEPIKISALKEKLISKEGIGLTSANNAIIDYRFTIDNGSNFEERINTIQFVFRPSPNEADIPILYIDAREEWVRDLLSQKGTSLATNEASLIPFRRQMGFARIAREAETQIVEIGNQTVRDGFDRKKKALIRKVRRLTYQSYV